MKTRIVQAVPILLVLLAIGFSYFSQWCTNTGGFCYRTWLDRVFLGTINPLYFFALFFLPMAALLVFIPRDIFKTWLRFTAWVLPFIVLLIVFMPDSSPGAYLDFSPFYRDNVARLAGGIYALASLCVIVSRALLVRAYARQDGLKEYLASWWVSLASITGFLFVLTFIVVGFSKNFNGFFVLGIVSLLSSSVFNAYAAWHMFTSWPSRDLPDKFLRYAAVVGIVGFTAAVLIAFSPAYRNPISGTGIEVMVATAVFAGIGLVAYLLQALKDTVRKMRGEPASLWRFILALFMLALSFAGLLFAGIFF